MNYARHEAMMIGEVRRLFKHMATVTRARLLGKQARRGTRHWGYDGPPVTSQPGKAIDPSRVFDVARWKREVENVLGGVLTNIVKESGDALYDTFRSPPKAAVHTDASFNVHQPNVSRAINNRVDRITGIVDTTADQIRGALEAGEANGESIRNLAARVQDIFSAASTGRAETIARTEVVGAVNEGNFYAAEQTGLNLTKIWLSIIDDRTRGLKPEDEFDHVAADGEEVSMGDSFTETGETLDYPGDPNGSPGNTINCRCTVIYGGDELGTVGPTDDTADLTDVTPDDGAFADTASMTAAEFDDTPVTERNLLIPDHVSEVVAQADHADEVATTAYGNDQTALGVNTALRNGESTFTDSFYEASRPTESNLVKALDRAADSTAMRADALLYRGGVFSEEQIAAMVERGGIQDLGYASTTTRQNLAEGYATARFRMAGERGDQVLFRMAVPRGTPAFQGAFGSNEIVLGRGQSWRIVRTAREDKRWIIDLERL